MKDGSSILDNIAWPNCIVKELQKESKKKSEDDDEDDDIKVSDLIFSFKDVTGVKAVETPNICCLKPCDKLEDALQYHDELLERGRSSKKHMEVHNFIGVRNCEKSAELTGRCKLAFREKFSEDLINKHKSEVGDVNKYNEKY